MKAIRAISQVLDEDLRTPFRYAECSFTLTGRYGLYAARHGARLGVVAIALDGGFPDARPEGLAGQLPSGRMRRRLGTRSGLISTLTAAHDSHINASYDARSSAQLARTESTQRPPG